MKNKKILKHQPLSKNYVYVRGRVDEGAWEELGEFFFREFIALPEGPERTEVKQLWDGLTKNQQAACEGM